MLVLDIRKIKLFLIKQQIRSIAFKLKLLNYFKIYPVILCIYLEFTLLEYLVARLLLSFLIIKGKKKVKSI